MKTATFQARRDVRAKLCVCAQHGLHTGQPDHGPGAVLEEHEVNEAEDDGKEAATDEDGDDGRLDVTNHARGGVVSRADCFVCRVGLSFSLGGFCRLNLGNVTVTKVSITAFPRDGVVALFGLIGFFVVANENARIIIRFSAFNGLGGHGLLERDA